MVGHRVSHANNKTKRRFLVNLQYHRFWLENEKRWVKMRTSAAAVRMINRKGFDAIFAELKSR